MAARRQRTNPPAGVAFWDTSAIVSLCLFQPQSSQANQILRSYRRQITWWATPVEAVSALNRLSRDEVLAKQDKARAFERLNKLRRSWNEVQPSLDLRDSAERLLNVHGLRAADALQLAAALVWCRQRPHGRAFVVADEGLSDAAEAEGFTVIRLL